MIMKTVCISDITLALNYGKEVSGFTFKEKTEVAKLLDRLCVSTVELGTLTDTTEDILLIKSVASAVKDAEIAVSTGIDTDKIDKIFEALKCAEKPRLQVCAAASTARMEYVYHKKSDKMLEAVTDAVKKCKSLCDNIEFIAEDATRANFDFLVKIISAAVTAGAVKVTLCDTAGVMLPDEFGAFIKRITEEIPEISGVTLGVQCSNALGVADACAITALKNGANEIKVTSVTDNNISLLTVSKLLSSKADSIGVKSLLKMTEINRVIGEIERFYSKDDKDSASPFENGVRSYSENMSLTKDSTAETVEKAIAALGYTLDDNDKMRVWKAFCDIAQRKDSVSAGELDAIIASEAMQVPSAYTLESYVVTTSNSVDIQAHIKLKYGDKLLDGLSLGDGPIDAAFLAIEKITGHHYELDDFQIQAVTEGREAMGQTVVKLRYGGKIYSGSGISTDIIGSGVLAYINALNKIIYEEENA